MPTDIGETIGPYRLGQQSAVQNIAQEIPDSVFYLFSYYPDRDSKLNHNKNVVICSGTPLKLATIYLALGSNLDALSIAGGVFSGLSLSASLKEFAKEWLDYQRDLEAELARSVQAVDAIESARVLSAINPTFIRLRSTVPLPGTPQVTHPDEVAEAVVHALFDANPKRRYMVVPDEREAEHAQKKQVAEVLERLHAMAPGRSRGRSPRTACD